MDYNLSSTQETWEAKGVEGDIVIPIDEIKWVRNPVAPPAEPQAAPAAQSTGGGGGKKKPSNFIARLFK
ncbi:MAG: hypothetical protein WCG05_04180 [Alphaproteobacteria bacterium]